MLSNSGSSSNSLWQLRIPSPNTFHKGITSSQEGFSVFFTRLDRLVSSKPLPTEQSKAILLRLKTIDLMSEGRWEFPDEWDAWSEDPKPMVRSAARAAKDLVRTYVEHILVHPLADNQRRYHSGATTYLRISNISYHALVIAHLRVSTQPVARTIAVEIGSDQNPELLEVMHSYFDKLPNLVKGIIDADTRSGERSSLRQEEVEDAWLTMIFRAFCWQRSHIMIPDNVPLPSEYWNSKMPVYIG
jgi:hypothetical protein